MYDCKSTKVIIDGNLNIIFDNMIVKIDTITDIIERFIKEFKNIEILLLDFDRHYLHDKLSFLRSKLGKRNLDISILCNILQLFIESNKNINIIYKKHNLFVDDIWLYNKLMELSNYNFFLDIENNIIVDNGGASFVQDNNAYEFKKYCVENNINFKSNIGY